ncbi:MAG: DNA-directed RNA polymerase subunit beta [bacterium]
MFKQRKNYGKFVNAIEIPNLLEMQKKSYEEFLQLNALPENREDKGLQRLFKTIFPIEDYSGNSILEFVSYSLSEPLYSVKECQIKDKTYSVPLKVKLRLIIKEQILETKEKKIRDIKEQEIHFASIPLMTENSTFIINGIERVIVNQLHRSPGLLFEENKKSTVKGHSYKARVIPFRGSWLEFEIGNLVYVRIDRKRKMNATILLRALGLYDSDILGFFYDVETIDLTKNSSSKWLALLEKRICAEDVIDKKIGEIIIEAKEEISSEKIELLKKFNPDYIKVLPLNYDNTILITLKKDLSKTPRESLLEIYSKLRSGNPLILEKAKVFFDRLFFSFTTYDLGKVGRFKINKRLGLNLSLEENLLTKEDIVFVLKYLIGLKNGQGFIDDIDHLGNRRIRLVGEVIEDRLRNGFVRMRREIKERMTLQEIETVMPNVLVNVNSLMATINKFFRSSELSQFMDQVNPLAELTHKRRISALGIGGITRERAGFEVRDVHYTHYGRICPIETPEGLNIGLITSFTIYSKVNELGFIETPYFSVKNGKVDKTKMHYLSAIEEDDFIVASSDAKVNKDDVIENEFVLTRNKGNFLLVKKEEVNYIDVSSMQLISLSTSLIPFLEHDDANRALMGSNMQRQAVPLLKTESPIIGTGMEKIAAKESGVMQIAERDGKVVRVSGNAIIVKGMTNSGKIYFDTYCLRKYEKSNNDTCINQIPIVKTGDEVKKGDILADGQSTSLGELALGQNVIVAFMPWNGYNFEDAIVINEDVVRKEKFTSIHIKEFEVEAQITKLGKEEITRDIPNASEESLKNLDKDGIIKIGTYVEPGDILVGKITPRGQTEFTPEEKLLRVIFKDKAGDVKDASLKVSAGIYGQVIDVKVFCAKRKNKDIKKIEKEIEEKEALLKEKINWIKKEYKEELEKLILNQKILSNLIYKDNVIIQKNSFITKENIELIIKHKKISELNLEDSKISKKLLNLTTSVEELIEQEKISSKKEQEKMKKGDELLSGVDKKVKVFIAQKKRMVVGDKISGRHGNKGVIGKIAPREEMPYMLDGRPVDIILNPLGVPSRLNIGQILEAHFGWVAAALGFNVETPVFIGATSEEVMNTLKEVSEKERKEKGKNMLYTENGKITLFDGRTGEPFEQQITVGYMYMMKLFHLADDKIHARSSGPYSLVTQQPLGGKVQFGGQRLGEMEVWALEAYGAAHILQEMLTVKSDDIEGRMKTYEAIVKGQNIPFTGIPESFNVLIKELQGLCLDIEFKNDEKNKKDLKNDEKTFSSLQIRLCSPEKILSWSSGEIKKSETINYRTYKTEREGLFCEKIFGPVKDWECYCGKYKGIKYKGVICDRCGVELTRSNVRRQKMGHIKLAAPVIHSWFLKINPSPIAKLLDFKVSVLKNILYFGNYIVTNIVSSKQESILLEVKKSYTKELKKINEEVEEKIIKLEKSSIVAFPVKDEQENQCLDKGKTLNLEILYDLQKKGIEQIKIYLLKEVLLKEKEDFFEEEITIQKTLVEKSVEELIKEFTAEKEIFEQEREKNKKECSLRYEKIIHLIKSLKQEDILNEEQYNLLSDHIQGFAVINSGPLAIQQMLQKIDVEKLSKETKAKIKTTKSVLEKKELLKKVKIVESFRTSGNKPEWLVMTILPVIPPDLRPLVHLEGGKFASSDLNDLYRRIINRNNRLSRLMEINAPEIILRNEKRMLQEAVDALIDNEKCAKPVLSGGARPLKSLSELIRGKQGRFRQNLLGKRVDYSGRAVIVVGPELKMHQCGLPKKMAVELFKPFILNKLEEKGYAQTAKSAKRAVQKIRPEVWEVLEEIVHSHTILLNRAPTLHRLSIQAFEPVLIEGNAISINPLVCSSFNADFDGDAMAVHLPLSPEAQSESMLLMLSVNNILSSANGKSVFTPTQEMVLGCYYLTKSKKEDKKEKKMFSNIDEVILSLDRKMINLHSFIKMKLNNEIIETTPGRVIFNSIFESDLDFVNKEVDKNGLSKIIIAYHKKFGNHKTVQILDKIKEVGFKYATLGGITISLEDVIIPEKKEKIVQKSKIEVEKVTVQYKKGLITNGERYNKVIDIWVNSTEEVANAMFEELEKDKDGLNPIYIMADSGARGNRLQVRQLAGMRGLMAKPSGEIIESPIISNFKEGLTVLEYFISTHGARKGLADTAVKTADAGYLTRKLVDVAQDVTITERDCGTTRGRVIEFVEEGREGIESFSEKIIGRVTLDNIVDPVTDEVIIKVGQEIVEEIIKKIENLGIEKIKVRSVLTCEAERGVCQLCYGRDLSTGKIVEIGEAVGIIAAQSIGEPGTQLTMRTFHIGGTASRTVEQSRIESKNDGIVKYVNIKMIVNKEGEIIVLTRNGLINIYDDQGRERETYQIPIGAILKVKDGQKISKHEVLVQWTLYLTPILTDVSGKVVFKDIIEGVTMNEEIDEITSFTAQVIIEPKIEAKRKYALRPQILVEDDEGNTLAVYDVPVGSHLLIQNNDKIFAGDILAKIHKKIGKTKDITGGLPRVSELFEVRKSLNAAIISEIDGVVSFVETSKGERKIVITGENDSICEYKISHGKHVIVHKGDKITDGDCLVDGPIDLYSILKVKGEMAAQEYLVNEVQSIYRLQGVEINDKHIEIIVKQMLKNVKIESSGDTKFLEEMIVDKKEFNKENEKVVKKGGKPAVGKSVLMGITRTSLNTDSFISAASFQETTRILSNAAINGKVDKMRGLKENVIMGHLIPTGTGLWKTMGNYETVEDEEIEKVEK